MMVQLHGIYVPLITPFTATGQVATDALAALAHQVLDAGAAGLVALGTTAEAAALDAAERDEVLDVCAAVSRERGTPLVVGAGNSDTRASAAALARLADRPEVVAALVAVPSFVRPAEAGVLAHFTALAASGPVPLIVYHIPYRTGQAVGPAGLRELGRLPGVVGVKYATGRVDAETLDLLGDLPPDFAVLVGDDVVLSPMLALGVAGGIVASAHLATSRFTRLADAWQEGDITTARTLGAGLARLSAALFAAPNPTVLKAVLHAQGRIPSPDVRLPLVPPPPATVAHVLTVLEELDTAWLTRR
jgi:4-hydroxy-tetrahydrodipicolinate synthase